MDAAASFPRRKRRPPPELVAAGIAAAVFSVCDRSHGWRSWLAPCGRDRRDALALLASLLERHPEASAEALYEHLMAALAYRRLPAWCEAPGAVRAGYEAFRFAYLTITKV